jgi:hypothetical protein
MIGAKPPHCHAVLPRGAWGWGGEGLGVFAIFWGEWRGDAM